MTRNTSVILGVPIDALTMEEAVEQIFSLMENYKSDRTPRLVCTVNTDFIANTMGWGLKQVRHPELLSILRGADLVTADGMPIVWASGYLGPALKERVTGADLVPRLAREAALKGKSLYFLGGSPESAAKAADILKEACPGLVVAGCDSPMVHVEGPNLADAPEADGEIVDRINAASPDLLFVAFGNPKQEIFFARNRHRLKVPVTIGIGGTFDFIAGSIRRAPEWMRAKGLEWLFRFTQDPRRLWKRYLNDLVKLGSQIWPSIYQYQFALRVAPHAFLKKCRVQVAYKYMTRGSAQVLLLTMPGSVNAEAVPRLESLIPKRPGAHLVLDVRDVAFIDSAGLGLLLRVMHLWKTNGHEVLITGATPYAQRVMLANRLHDLFGHRLFPTLEDALAHLDGKAGKPPYSVKVVPDAGSSRLVIEGRLEPAAVSPAEVRVLAAGIQGKTCVMDLSGLDAISTQGVTLLLRLKRELSRLGKECTARGARGETARMLEITRTTSLL